MWTDRQVKSFEPKEKRYRVSDDLGQRGAGKRVMVKVGRYKWGDYAWKINRNFK